MTKFERYEIYKTNFLKKHNGSTNGLRSYNGWCKKNKYRSKAWNTYSLFSCDFETTAQKEFTDDDILNENKSEGVFDFTPDKYSKVFLSGIWSIKTGKYQLCYENIADTFNAIVKQTYNERHRRAICFYHNLAFDGSYIIWWLIQNGWTQTLEKDEKTGQPKLKRKQFAALISGGKYFNIIFYWRHFKLMFVDSMKILPQSLASLGELVGYKKLKSTVDYKQFKIIPNHKYPIAWTKYLKRDCQILAAIMKDFYKNKPEAESTKTMTIGSIAYKHIKGLINQNTERINVDEFYYWNQWYRGGLCFPSLKYQAKWVYKPKAITMVDACSHYPSQMIKDLPTGKAEPEPNPKWKSYCKFYEIKIHYALIKKKYNDIACIPIPAKWENRKKKVLRQKINDQPVPFEYLQEVENQTYYVIDKELEIWQQLYDMKFEILTTWYYELTPYLREEVNKMFLDKQKASRTHNDVQKQICKLLINNLYGKISQKPIKPQDYYGPLENINTDEYEVLGKKKLEFEAYNVQYKKKDTAKAQPVFVGAYITALARTKLLEKYKYITDTLGSYHFLYADTDSICFIDNPKQPIQFNDIGDNLGQWEFEVIKNKKLKDYKQKLLGDGFCSLCPKQYRIVRRGLSTPLKFASAGCKKEVMQYVKNQDYNYELGENKAYKICKSRLKNSKFGKIIDETSPFSFKKWKNYFPKIKCPKELYN